MVGEVVGERRKSQAFNTKDLGFLSCLGKILILFISVQMVVVTTY